MTKATACYKDINFIKGLDRVPVWCEYGYVELKLTDANWLQFYHIGYRPTVGLDEEIRTTQYDQNGAIVCGKVRLYQYDVDIRTEGDMCLYQHEDAALDIPLCSVNIARTVETILGPPEFYQVSAFQYRRVVPSVNSLVYMSRSPNVRAYPTYLAPEREGTRRLRPAPDETTMWKIIEEVVASCQSPDC